MSAILKLFKVINKDDKADQTPRVVETTTKAKAIAHVTEPYEAEAISARDLHNLQKDYPDLVIETAGEE